MLPRRKFIFQLGAVAGASMLPGCVGNPSNGAKKGVTVRVFFSYHLDDVQAKADWPNIGYDFRPAMENAMNALNANIPDVNFIASKAKNEEDAKAIAEKDGDEIAGYMVIQMNCWNPVINGVLPLKKPILFYSHPYAGDGGWLSRTTGILWDKQPHFAFIASLNFSDAVKAASAFSKLNGGTADDFDAESERIRKEMIPSECKAVAKEDNLKCLTAEETLAKVKGFKVLGVPDYDEPTISEIKKAFGIDVIAINYEEFNAISDKITDDEAQKVADKWKKNAIRVYDSTDEDIFLAAKSYLTQKALLKKYDAQAITINCLNACYGGNIKGYPCLGFMQLQDEGLIGVCEEDLSSTITMLVFRAMTGRTGYVSDPVLDFPTRSIIYAHCVCTTKFFGPDGPSSPYEILTHSEDRKGASVRTIAPIGYPVTTIFVNCYRKQIHVHTGVITGNSSDDRACRTKIIAEVTGDYDQIFRHWTGWHRVTFIGSFAEDVEKLAKLVGYEIIRES